MNSLGPGFTFAHGGHVRNLARLAGCRVEELLDFSANINPLGPPEALRRAISRHLDTVTHYPDPHCRALREAIAATLSLPEDTIVCGNGSTELLYALPLAFAHPSSTARSALPFAIHRALIPVPSYLDYAAAMTRAGLPITSIPLDAERGFSVDWERLEGELAGFGTTGSLVIIGQPNNPSGALFDPADLLNVADRHLDSLFVVDEAFIDFVADYRTIASYGRANIIVLRSMTKFYAIPGLRLGYAIAPAALAPHAIDAPLDNRQQHTDFAEENNRSTLPCAALAPMNTPLDNRQQHTDFTEENNRSTLPCAALARQLSAVLPPWSVGTLAQAAGIAVLQDRTYAHETRQLVSRLREQLHRGLVDLGGLIVFPSVANYLLVRLDRTGLDAPALARALLAHRIAIRVCDNYQGLDERYFRVAVRTEKENERLLDTLDLVLGGGKGNAGRGQPRGIPQPGDSPPDHAPVRPLRTASRPRQAPAIMFQGTASNAGKSVLAAAFCRILLQDGYRAAPFKAQNMSLNSHVTRTGGEMGRAQVVQAQACRLDPDVRMNPVLLKPNSDTGSQVIVLGKPVGNMDVDAYIRYKPTAFHAVRTAYDSLACEVDVMVIEGAGSPGEVNLKRHDIVNMAMADHAGAPVLLVGDIDRGGVFAAFVGTLEVLNERERARVAGFIVNRFRGQRELLSGAIDYVREHTGVPVLGVIPYLQALGLPEEDSVTFKATDRAATPRGADQVEIALIDLPHISNFTDFDALELEPDVHLRIIRGSGQPGPEPGRELASADAIILPGSKNVPGDLAWLRASGIAGAIRERAEQGVTIVGICGGLQMLGQGIADPHGIESGADNNVDNNRGEQPGLGLLPIRTVLETDKTLELVSARHPESKCSLKGYEIHHGHTHGEGARPAMVTEEGRAIGFATEDGKVSGTYLHGLYDNDLFRRWFIDTLRAGRGLAPLGSIQVHYDPEPALDRLARVVRENLDVERIYRRMGIL
uniref:Cobyric acid synthase n=1 Tax=Candidatus Kentrum sp. FM TaxID=2126340 RepID=A0A450T0N8_9GAMM|nr:MAG: cobyric acid synthase CobQ [Candidatus Kentron sp. FM]VFJ59822.1 MAG: cobyric acid synthase CobQ [Candidatus Kentron sp. FM]VFK14631.1 MAG: cobyric acid synthase CobQ [Candidatus Kentron sp. FM]